MPFKIAYTTPLGSKGFTEQTTRKAFELGMRLVNEGRKVTITNVETGESWDNVGIAEVSLRARRAEGGS